MQLRARFLNFDQMLAQSYDPYALMRDTYLQNRDQTVRKNLPDYNPDTLPDYGLPDDSGG